MRSQSSRELLRGIADRHRVVSRAEDALTVSYSVGSREQQVDVRVVDAESRQFVIVSSPICDAYLIRSAEALRLGARLLVGAIVLVGDILCVRQILAGGCNAQSLDAAIVMMREHALKLQQLLLPACPNAAEHFAWCID